MLNTSIVWDSVSNNHYRKRLSSLIRPCLLCNSAEVMYSCLANQNVGFPIC